MSDWADEMARGWKGGEVARKELAADFRKAKAAGMREAAEIVVMNGNANYSLQIHSFANGVTQAIGDIADKLEELT